MLVLPSYLRCGRLLCPSPLQANPILLHVPMLPQKLLGTFAVLALPTPSFHACGASSSPTTFPSPALLCLLAYSFVDPLNHCCLLCCFQVHPHGQLREKHLQGIFIPRSLSSHLTEAELEISYASCFRWEDVGVGVSAALPLPSAVTTHKFAGIGR